SELGLPIAKALTPDRKRKLHARLKEHGLSGWNDALVQIEQSSFLCGRGEKGWCASIDFLLQPSSFNKVLEGAYADERERA
ncbi:MAG: DNA replication protein, partial [Alphaproteobacteria bacterium]